METASLGKVIVTAKIENLHDLLEIQMGESPPTKLGASK